MTIGADLGGERRHRSGRRRRDLDQRLVGLDLDDRLVALDALARLDQPAHDLGLVEALADVGQTELDHRSTRRAAATTRSTLGT